MASQVTTRRMSVKPQLAMRDKWSCISDSSNGLPTYETLAWSRKAALSGECDGSPVGSLLLPESETPRSCRIRFVLEHTKCVPCVAMRSAILCNYRASLCDPRIRVMSLCINPIATVTSTDSDG